MKLNRLFLFQTLFLIFTLIFTIQCSEESDSDSGNNKTGNQNLKSLVVSLVKPSAGESAVNLASDINVTFNLEIDPKSLDKNTVTFFPELLGSSLINGKNLVFTPNQGLKQNTQYQVTLSKNLKSIEGKQLLKDFIWSFSTASLAPRVLSTLPADKAANVFTDTNIQIQFSEEIDPKTVNLNTILFNPKTAGKFKVDKKTITFTPDQKLAFSSPYQVTVTTQVKSTNGAAIEKGFSFGFMTEGSSKITFVSMGDFGTGYPEQVTVANAIAKVCRQKKCDFLIGLGDNIYPDGIKSVNDPQLKTKFVIPYKNLNFPFYLSLGNHDHRESIKAQVDYSKINQKWKMPNYYYTFLAKRSRSDIQFFALDTNPLSYYVSNYTNGMKSWLKSQLDQSKSTWKIVFGHHPWKSNGQHGNGSTKIQNFYKETLCNRADILITGHEHDKQHLKDECGVKLFISGAGSKLRSVKIANNTIFAKSSLGFTIIEIDKKFMRFEFFNEKAQMEYRYQYNKK